MFGKYCDLEYISCEPEVIPSKLRTLHKESLTSDVTVVSAYYGVERFQKSNEGVKFRYYYLHLLHTFSAIVSPVVFFTDGVEVAKEIQSLRSHLPPTKTNIVLMGRSDMWAFKICPLVNATEVVRQIRDMFPYRVAGTYICTMHAKCEVMHIAARMN